MDSKMDQNIKEKAQTNNQNHKWRPWHEREVPVKITGASTEKGVLIDIKSQQLNSSLELEYPNSIWTQYPKENKVKLVDNITYIFTAHLPFLLKGNIRTEYNTGYPQVFSWAQHCFMHFLPAYWYVYQGKRGTRVFPLLKTLLNSRSTFAETQDVPPRFPATIDEHVVIPFTFGKDSFLTYHIAKEIGLEPTLVYFNEPTELYSKDHKLKLISEFSNKYKEKIYFLDNPLGTLREYGEGWFGWELALTSWALLALPFTFAKKAGYIIFSNENSVNEFFYDEDGLKIIPDYEQSAQAIEELSLYTQSLSEGEVYTTTFLQGLNDLGILAILNNRYKESTFKYLMSCWAETEAAKDKRWCGECSKCARLYVYMLANGIDPKKDAGFQDNMLEEPKKALFNVFGSKASGTGWDAFGLNTNEQAFAFYVAHLRGNRDPLTLKFMQSEMSKYVEDNFDTLVETYYSLNYEHITPPQWKQQIDAIYIHELDKAKQKLHQIKKSYA